MTPSVEKQQLLRISNVTEEMSTYQDIRKIHTLVAHKLRTPLSLIYSSMNLLDSKMDFIPDDQIKPMVHSAWQNTERLVRDVRDILKFIDAPISLVGGAPVSLAELGYVANATGEILEVKEISVSIPEALAAQKLHISAHAMELIIYEILENSKKFHPNRSPSIQVRADMHGKNDIHLQFIDDGQIMTAEQIIHAKMPYLQSEKWFTGEVSGMGLGIPLVATMVWQAGGQLRVENRADQAGVCISLVLPIAPTETPLQEDTLIQ
jgi:K+-sensing histidine kinase KdpD